VENVNTKADPEELVRQFALYGEVTEWSMLEDEPSESYTDAYRITFKNIGDARFARRKLHKISFVGLDLKVTYACELETVEDVRQKLQERRDVVGRKVAFYSALDAIPKELRVHPKTTAEVWDERPITASEWLQNGGNPLVIPASASATYSTPPTSVERKNGTSNQRNLQQSSDHHPYYDALTASSSSLPPTPHLYQGVDYQQYYQQYFAQYYGTYSGYSQSSTADELQAGTNGVDQAPLGKKRRAPSETPKEGESRAKIPKVE
jgi:RNA recognition motif-containing protein